MGKQFKLIKPLGAGLGLKDIFIKDTVNDWYYYKTDQVVDKLNEQQEEIDKLKKENFGLYDGWDCLQEINSARKDEIYEKDRTIEEQQNIIEKQERQIIHLTEEVIAYKKLVDEECD